jgi:acyl-coenzyme A thioesterase PaaI-like protein
MTAAVDPVSHEFDLGNWLGRTAGEHEDLDFTRLAEAVRHLQHQVAGSRPPAEVSRSLAMQFEAIASKLQAHQVSEAEQLAGRQFALPSRGQSLVPPLVIDAYDGDKVEARVTFGRFYLGSNGAAHGGAISLMFDDLLGQLANGAGRPPARTAYLHVDYRDIVPLDQELVVTARVARVEGRKAFVEGGLFHGAHLLTEASGLFVRLEAHHR